MLMEANRSDLPPIDSETTTTATTTNTTTGVGGEAANDKSPSPIHTPKDLVEIDIGDS